MLTKSVSVKEGQTLSSTKSVCVRETHSNIVAHQVSLIVCDGDGRSYSTSQFMC